MNHQAFKLKDPKSPYIVYYNPSKTLPPMVNLPEEGMKVVSIDVGIKNFAMRVEHRYPHTTVASYFDKIDFTKVEGEEKGVSTVDPQVYLTSIEHIESMKPHLIDARVIIMERQMAKNHQSSMMFQHILSYLLSIRHEFIYPDIVISDISPKLKGMMLGCPKGLGYVELKKWGIEKAKELLSERNDQWSLDVIKYHQGKTKTKADDLSDTVIQMEAWFLYHRQKCRV